MKAHPIRSIKQAWAGILATILLFSSCITEDIPDNTPWSNFEALWKTIDTQYCYLDYKKEAYGLDWNEVHTRYHNRLTDDMGNKALFQVLSEMLEELRDGHVNLVSSSETSQYRAWYDSYPANFVDTIQRIYLGKDYTTVAGLKYQILEDNIGYIYYGSFSSGVGEGNLDAVLDELSICDGLILDVRNNGGGLLTMADRWASRFTNEKVLTLTDAYISVSIKCGGSYVVKYAVYDTGYIYSLSGYTVNENYKSLDKTSYGDLFDIYVRLGGKH